ncbi:potassium transporter Kef [Nocardioides panzhihuensis]|uniref:Uncharacterized protein n=1 Tax=Nocardioides panzhihuensis TaxID=860243 RepID=A0A7Z0DT52_9ACTN|nr:potassium transporter Kef [Nocardioides panzhihuensis]NYI80851.1 hypothetical protein [Nocardioides panzhihuensis]
MIRRPGHSVNAAVRRESAPLPSAAGLDLELAVANVARWVGDPQLFSRFLAAGLAGPTSVSVDVGQDLAAVAAWRAGVIGLRTDALRAVSACLDAGLTDAVGATLGMPGTDVAGFVEGQRTDRFFWPAWQNLGRAYLVARIGGFAGLGGPWLAHPGDVIATGEGQWLVEVGEELWEIDADLFGHSVSPADSDPTEAGDPVATAATPGIRVVSVPTSYLLEVVREAA